MLDDNPRFNQSPEDFPIEQLVAQLVVEAFDVAVFPRAVRINVICPHLLFDTTISVSR